MLAVIDSPRVYIASLSDYNNGRLVGWWFDLEDFAYYEDLLNEINKKLLGLGLDECGEAREEYAIHDFEYCPDFGEYDLEAYFNYSEEVKEHGIDVMEALSHFGLDQEKAVDVQIRESWKSFVWDYIIEVLQVPDGLLSYIDKEYVKDEIKFSGYTHKLEDGRIAFCWY